MFGLPCVEFADPTGSSLLSRSQSRTPNPAQINNNITKTNGTDNVREIFLMAVPVRLSFRVDLRLLAGIDLVPKNDLF